MRKSSFSVLIMMKKFDISTHKKNRRYEGIDVFLLKVRISKIKKRANCDVPKCKREKGWKTGQILFSPKK